MVLELADMQTDDSIHHAKNLPHLLRGDSFCGSYEHVFQAIIFKTEKVKSGKDGASNL